MSRLLTDFRAFLLLLSGLLLSLYIGWMANAHVEYGYSWLYKVLDIEEHIAEFGPQNRYRSGFELVGSTGHIEAFSEIVKSVHNCGLGLSDIKYEANNQELSLLHEAEILHLQDVANLIDSIHQLAGLVFLFFVIVLLIEFKWPFKTLQVVRKKSVAAIFSALIAISMLIVLVVGPQKVFYQMHIWIFPDNHQWFFYYQDSLMSTMMKAPDLFAGIALQIIALSTLVFAVGLLAWGKIKKVQAR